MKISKLLPQFENEKALLVVLSSQSGVFYLGQNYELSKIGSFTVPKPHYSDKEGRYAQRSRGKTISVGAVRELDKVGHNKEVLRELVATIKKLKQSHDINQTYLYAPPYLMRQIKTSLKKIISDSYTMSFTGNYYDFHPTDLLQMINKRQNRRASRRLVVPTKGEAQKLLRQRS